MKLAYDPSMFRDSMTLKQMFDEVARLGYEYVELSPRRDFIWFYEHPVADHTLIKQVKKYAKDAGVKISSVLPVQQWSSPDEQEREFAVRNLKRTIEITAELEVPVLNTEFAGDKFQPLVSQGQWYKSMAELAPVMTIKGTFCFFASSAKAIASLSLPEWEVKIIASAAVRCVAAISCIW